MNPGSIGIIFGALGAAFVAGTGGWLARGLVVDHLEIPRVITHQVELCQSEVSAAAADAIAAEQLRQFRAGEWAANEFLKQSQVAADDATAKQEVLELEIERYAQRVRDGGSVCALSGDDLDLLGVRSEPGRSAPGGR